jgi:GTP:adenosylcobinamide-phosphate guanylyltransferase
MPLVDALIMAGGVPKPDEPLYPYTQGKSKALLEIAGQPMIQWILEALNGAQTIRRVLIVGLNQDDAPLRCRKPLDFLPNHGGLLENIEAGVKWVVSQGTADTHALLVSSDIPTITSAVVDWNVETSLQTDHELYYSLIPQAAMEKRFPGSKRSYFKLKDGTYTGGDMNLIATRMMKGYHPAWRGIVDRRKNILKQASLIGFDTLLLFALRQLTVADAERVASQRLGLAGRALICPHAEAGMDVDKPRQYDIVQRDLQARRPGA